MAGTQGARRPKNSNTSRKSNKGRDKQDDIKRDITVITAFAVSLLLFLCNFHVIGAVGNAISGVMFGLIGTVSYVAPAVVFMSVLFAAANPGNGRIRKKIMAGIGLSILVGIFIQLATGKMSEITEQKYISAVITLYEEGSVSRLGGGVISGSIAYVLYKLISMAGTIIVTLALSIISIVILTNSSISDGIKKGRDYIRELRQPYDDEEEWDYEDEETYEIAPVPKKSQRKPKTIKGITNNTLLEEENIETVEHPRAVKPVKDMLSVKNNIVPVSDVTAQPFAVSVPSPDMEKASARKKSDIHEVTMPKEEIFDPDSIRIHGMGEGGFVYTAIPEHELPRPLGGSVNAISRTARIVGEQFDDKEKKARDIIESLADDSLHNFEEVSALEDNISESDDIYGGETGADNAETHRIELKPAAIKIKEAAPAKPVVKETETAQAKPSQPRPYKIPPVSLLQKGVLKQTSGTEKQLKETARNLQQTLATFGVKVTVTDISKGPAVTRYEIQPEQGVKVSRIVALSDDIKLNLAATDIRIEAPIPGKAAVGIEVPNKENESVAFRSLIESKEYKEFPSNISFAVGKDISGKTVVADIARMPHMLIAGATGSGKSVCINTLIMSILYKAKPDEVKLIMIDPKVVELSVYNGIPHLMIPVVTDPKKAAEALRWAVAEMEDRYQKFAETNVRDLKGYNKKAVDNGLDPLHQLVIIVDELADLMMVASKEVEEYVCRLAQLARAAGIHLIIATQRPSVDVITGLIKANMPSRVAFAVSSGVDSRTILDMNGAEKLLGKGDMLFYPQGYPKPVRVQGAFVSDQEVFDVTEFLKSQSDGDTVYDEEVLAHIESAASDFASGGTPSDIDPLFAEAGRMIIDKEKASIGMLQRAFKIGFNRAARIMDQLEEAGIVGREEGTKPRKVIMSLTEFENLMGNEI